MSKKDKKYHSLEMELRGTVEDINGVPLPILNDNTEQIIINCHGGAVVDVKPLLKFRGK